MFITDMRNSSANFFCDNLPIVYSINSKTTRYKQVLTLLRPMILLFMKHNVNFCATHIPCEENVLSDKLSRLQVPQELLQSLGMETCPLSVPHKLRPHNLTLSQTD